MTTRPTTAFCCTDARSLLFAGGVFLLTYGAFRASAVVWPMLQAFQTPAILAAIGLGCVANFWRNRTVHCAITGPVFLIAAAMLSADASISGLVRALVLMGTGIALLVEYRYAAQR